MVLHALDDVDDAIEATERFLLPFDRVRWFRLAVVMFFLGGAVVPSVPFGGGGVDVDEPAADAPGDVTIEPEITPELVALVVGVVLLLLGIGLLYAVASAVMEFVFVASLRDEEVRLRRNAARYWRRGVRLFAFRLAVWVVTLGGLSGFFLAVGSAFAGWPPTEWSVTAAFALVVLAVPVLLVAFLVVGNLLGFTTVFVVPIMLAEDRGVVSAWRRFWPTLAGQWKQYLAYAVVAFLLGIGVGIASSFLSLLAFIALAIPFAIVGVPLVLVFGLNPVTALVALVLGLLFAVLLLVALLLVQVPLQTFLRYYALFVLGDTNEDFDVISDARAAVRADGGASGIGAGSDGGDGNGPDDGDGDVTDGGSDVSDGDDGDVSVGGDEADRGDDEWNVDRDDRRE